MIKYPGTGYKKINTKYLCAVSHKPVTPVEDPAERRGLVRPTQGNEGLDEGEGEGREAEDWVGIGHDEHEAVWPASNVQEYQDNARYGPCPHQHHKKPGYDEKVIVLKNILYVD